MQRFYKNNLFGIKKGHDENNMTVVQIVTRLINLLK